MDVQINTDATIEGREELARHVETKVAAALSRFAGRLTRVEVHLGDVNAGKAGAADKRCMIEARPSGQPPVVVTHHAATLDEACNGAVQKLGSLLGSKFGRQADHRGAASVRDNDQR